MPLHRARARRPRNTSGRSRGRFDRHPPVNAPATFSAPRVSTRSDVPALFVLCGRSERAGPRAAGDRERWQLHIRMYESTSIRPQPDCQTADCNAASAAAGCIGSAVAPAPGVVGCTMGNLISRRLYALRSRYNRRRRRSRVAARPSCLVFRRDARETRKSPLGIPRIERIPRFSEESRSRGRTPTAWSRLFSPLSAPKTDPADGSCVLAAAVLVNNVRSEKTHARNSCLCPQIDTCNGF